MHAKELFVYVTKTPNTHQIGLLSPVKYDSHQLNIDPSHVETTAPHSELLVSQLYL
jgi:hypothetical protein